MTLEGKISCWCLPRSHVVNVNLSDPTFNSAFHFNGMSERFSKSHSWSDIISPFTCWRLNIFNKKTLIISRDFCKAFSQIYEAQTLFSNFRQMTTTYRVVFFHSVSDFSPAVLGAFILETGKLGLLIDSGS